MLCFHIDALLACIVHENITVANSPSKSKFQNELRQMDQHLF